MLLSCIVGNVVLEGRSKAIYYIQNQGLRCEDEKPPQHTQGQQEHNVGFFLA